MLQKNQTTKIVIISALAVMSAISQISAENYLSHTLFLDVESSSDGNGNFTYSFTGSSDNPDFGFYFADGLGTISISAFGIEAIQTPSGWQGSSTGDGLVTFQYTGVGGVWIHDSPLIFNLSSSLSTTTLYDDVGEASAPFTEFGDPNNGGWGTETFSYIGPVPEPSATALFVLGTIAVVRAAWRRSSETRPNNSPEPTLFGHPSSAATDNATNTARLSFFR